MRFLETPARFGKLTEKWRGLFLIDSFGGDHGASYTLKTTDGKLALDTHRDDHLRDANEFAPFNRILGF